MFTRLLSVAQLVFGGLMLSGGVTITLFYLSAVNQVTTATSQVIHDFALQVEITSQTLQEEKGILDDVDRTAAASAEFLQDLDKSSNEFVNHKQEWIDAGQNIKNLLDGIGNSLESLGNAFDFSIPYGVETQWGSWHGLPYPNGLRVKESTAVRDQARGLSRHGKEFHDIGKTINTTVETLTSEMGRNQKAMVKVIASTHQLLTSLRGMVQTTQKRNVPSAIAEMGQATKKLNEVAGGIDKVGPLVLGAGLLGVCGGLVCFLNAFALWSVDNRLRQLIVTNSVQAGV